MLFGRRVRAENPQFVRGLIGAISAEQLSAEVKSRHEEAKTGAEFLDTVGDDDCSGLLQPCVRSNQLQSYRFGH